MVLEPPETSPDPLLALRAVIKKHWGYRTFRPLQEEAMRAVLAARDSLVVMPTGGGKSLCYQAPALIRAQNGGGTTVVVSPLISLMKDQVDALRANGVVAAQIDSSISSEVRAAVLDEVRAGAMPLVFISPERLVMPSFQAFLRDSGVNCFAIDEAHCISHWGHDFRPEYRQLAQLKSFFPGAAIHAFTATATTRVRADIAEQLKLTDPAVLVGNFDRPNLIYRVFPRRNPMSQIREVLDRHKNEAGIIYCIRRKDVDELAADLKAAGYKALPYHAGLTPEQRRAAQNAFSGRGGGNCDLIVATVAFGMGIDRSDIRFVLHTAMPKSVEAYQQETGRGGRDGLEAECVLLYSGADFMSWKGLIERSAEEAKAKGVAVDPAHVPTALAHIEDMDRYARSAVCRHQSLVEYFGQKYIPPAAEPISDDPNDSSAARHLSLGAPHSCAACDVCLGDLEPVPDALIIAQKILSCVARVQERFGVAHVCAVLRGENTERVRGFHHDQLTTYGLLKDLSQQVLRDYVHQLIGQKVLVQEAIERNGQRFPILRLNRASVEVMKKQRDVRLLQSVRGKDKSKKSRAETISWEGVDRELFEALRGLRREIAAERSVAHFVIFSDATLREVARVRPSTIQRLRAIYGFSETKLRDFGSRVLSIVQSHTEARTLSRDNSSSASSSTEGAPAEAAPATLSGNRRRAFKMFRTGQPIAVVAGLLKLAPSTISQYLVEFIAAERPVSVSTWVSDGTYERIHRAAKHADSERLKPLFEALDGQIPYEEIRITIAHLKATQG